MNPFDFLTLARNLSGGDKEASWRSSISRSYYALFNFMKDELSGKGVIIATSSKGHGELKTFLVNSGIAEAEEMGSLIGDIYGQRITADYKMNKEVTQGTAKIVLQKASEVWQTFQGMDKNLLATEIKKFQSKNNYI